MPKSTRRRSAAASQAALRARTRTSPAGPPAPVPPALQVYVDRLVLDGWSPERAEALVRRHGDVLGGRGVPAPRSAPVEVDQVARLRRVARSLRELEVRRVELLAERGRLVDQLRARGESWDRVARAAGVSRPTLIQARRPR